MSLRRFNCFSTARCGMNESGAGVVDSLAGGDGFCFGFLEPF
jgi:hypothetical protein